jgi:pimeloyl-ACP methyl ester carboxylesterase
VTGGIARHAVHVPVPGGAVAAWTAGTAGTAGQPLLLVHGGGVDSRIWAEVVSPLGARYRVAGYDRRGAGQSRAVPAGDQVRDLVAVRERLFGAAPVWLVGSSFGATIALATAVRHGAAGLVLESPRFADSPGNSGRQDALRAAAAAGPGPLVDAWMADPHLAPRRPPARDLLAAVLADNVALFTAAPGADFTPPSGADLASVVRAGVPVLVLAGDRDVPAVLDHYARLVPDAGASLVRVPDAGHLVHLDDPDRFRAEVHAALLSRSPG